MNILYLPFILWYLVLKWMGVAILCLPYIFSYPTVYYRVLLNQPCNGTMSTMYCIVATTQHYGALWTFGWWLWWPNNRGLYNQATSTMYTPSDGGVLWVFPDEYAIVVDKKHTSCVAYNKCEIWCHWTHIHLLCGAVLSALSSYRYLKHCHSWWLWPN